MKYCVMSATCRHVKHHFYCTLTRKAQASELLRLNLNLLRVRKDEEAFRLWALRSCADVYALVKLNFEWKFTIVKNRSEYNQY